MVTLETVLAAAMRHDEVAERLGPLVTSDLVVAGPFKRRIMEFAVEFRAEQARLPKSGDYQAWLDTLPDQVRKGVKENLGRLQQVDLSEITPEHLAEHAAEELETVAARTARNRLNEMGDELDAEALRNLVRQMDDLRARISDFSHLSWPEPPARLGPGTPEPYPVEVLPDWVRAQVENVAQHTQTPTDLPVLLALPALGIMTANKAVLKIREGHREPAIVWTAAIMESGTRKSPAFKHLVDRHILDLEDELARETAPDRDRRESLRRQLEKARKTLEKKAADLLTDHDLDPKERQDELRAVESRLDDLAEDLRGIGSSAPPRLAVSGDVTSERLPQLMQENQGRIGALAPEAGDLFRILAGQYSSSPVIGIWQRGWTGSERARDDRVGREGSYVRRPAITVGVTFQPSVLEELERKRTLRGEGLLARFLYAKPEVRTGWRKTGAEIPGLDRDVDERWNEHLRRLHDSEPLGEDHDGDWVQHTLDMAPGARDLYYAFEADVERMLRPGGRLEHIRDWGAKLHGQAARVALLLHAAHRVGEDKDPWSAPVSEKAMRGGVAIARAAIPHALDVFDALEADPEVALGRYLVRRLQKMTEERDGRPPTKSELHEVVSGKVGLETVGKMDVVLRLLEEHRWLELVERPSPGRGRPPSPWVVLHPEAAEAIRKIRKNRELSTISDFSDANRETENGPAEIISDSSDVNDREDQEPQPIVLPDESHPKNPNKSSSRTGGINPELARERLREAEERRKRERRIRRQLD